MTYRKWAEDYLFNFGLTECHAKEVVEIAIRETTYESLKGRWEESRHESPRALLILVKRTIDQCAMAWIERNDPNAWYKPFFDGSIT